MKLTKQDHQQFADELSRFMQKLRKSKGFSGKNTHARDAFLYLSYAIWHLQDWTLLQEMDDMYNPKRLHCEDFKEEELIGRVLGCVSRGMYSELRIHTPNKPKR
jgi:hypothetical protein